jgi:hypothetical protein
MNVATFMTNVRRELRKQWKHVKIVFGHAGKAMSYDQVRGPACRSDLSPVALFTSELPAASQLGS